MSASVCQCVVCDRERRALLGNSVESLALNRKVLTCGALIDVGTQSSEFVRAFPCPPRRTCPAVLCALTKACLQGAVPASSRRFKDGVCLRRARCLRGRPTSVMHCVDRQCSKRRRTKTGRESLLHHAMCVCKEVRL